MLQDCSNGRHLHCTLSSVLAVTRYQATGKHPLQRQCHAMQVATDAHLDRAPAVAAAASNPSLTAAQMESVRGIITQLSQVLGSSGYNGSAAEANVTALRQVRRMDRIGGTASPLALLYIRH